MKLTKLSAAEVAYYNANNRGKSVDDCVKRSISLATDLPYSEVSKILNAKMKELNQSAWNIPSVFDPVIKEFGGEKVSVWNRSDNNEMTLEEFVDNEADPNGVYILLVGKKPGSSSHMVTVRNGKIWDSWDSRDRYVTRYYVMPGNLKPVTDIKSRLPEIAIEFINPVIQAELDKQMNKKGWNENNAVINHSAYFNDYTIKNKYRLVLEPNDLITKRRTYWFEISFPIEPTMSEEEAIEYGRKVGKQRAYDRIWTIGKQEKELAEAAEMEKLVGPGKDIQSDWRTNEAGLRFVKTLPGWARPLVEEAFVDSPGKYHDSYYLVMRLLPGDDLHPDLKTAEFKGYEADEVRQKINEYKKSYRLPGIDYEEY